MIVKIQNRRGQYIDFDPSKLLPGEFAIVQTGNPNTADGKAIYICVTAGNVKQIATLDELQSEVETALQSAIPEFVEEATQEAEAAADRAEAAAQTLEIDTTLTRTNQAAEAKAVGDELTNLKADLEQLEPGLSEEAKAALLTCFRHVAFLDEDADYYGDLESALYSGDIVSINATFAQNQNVFSSTDKLSDLIPFLTVTATYGDGTQNTINDYTLSGSLTDGTSVITVSYKAKTTTFSVDVTTVPSGYTMKNYVDSNGTPYMITQIPETAAVNWWYRLKEMRTGYENRNGHVFSSSNAYTPYLFALGQAVENRINAKRFGIEVTSGTYLTDIWETNIVYEIESFKDNNSIYLNGEEVASVPIGATMSSNNTFALLGYRGADGVVAERFRFIGRFYYLKIFDNNNRKAHDFVPCINSSNVVGIYDLVDGIFYAPATGTLIAG